MKLHAPLAVRYGYDVQVFAPGESYSGVINPLDFMRDAQDAVMAAEIGSVIARNASLGESSRIRAAEQLLPHPHDPSDPVTTADVQSNQAVGKIRELLKNKAISGVRND
ncbi:hypothetical protein ACE1CI_12060 [Aerosakkonemataceae cyanobacterium BLCC-F50]|uniref:Uncharacterized protein n=1 Tax=Floridaenema flaviceps BLCC-F50 TaxID=3153642 RepID=A0ABV4XQ95_9CYAN